MPLGINSVVGAGIHHARYMKWGSSYTNSISQVPTSTLPEEANATPHVHLTFYSDINSVVGAYHYPILFGVGNKAQKHPYPLPLTCKAIPFIYKRGCAPSNEKRSTSSNSDSLDRHQHLTTAGPPSSDHNPFGRSQPNLLYTPSFLLLVCNPTTDFEHLGSGIKSPTDPD